MWVADIDGSNARQVVAGGWSGELSPDGRRVTYHVRAENDTDDPSLYVHDVGGGKPRLIPGGIGAVWSPDGSQLAVDDGKTLFLIDVNSGKRRELAHRVALRGFSFAPDGNALAYARADRRPEHEYESDVFVLRLSDEKTEQVTHDGHSDSPVWGGSWIVYRHFRFVNDDHWPSIGELWLMHPDGSAARSFAKGRENLSQAQWGLDPLEISGDGKRLLACNACEFSCTPVGFTVPDGKHHELAVEGERGMIPFGSELSRDGTEVLVEMAPFDGYGERAYAVPFEGGRARLLVKQGASPSWAR